MEESNNTNDIYDIYDAILKKSKRSLEEYEEKLFYSKKEICKLNKELSKLEGSSKALDDFIVTNKDLFHTDNRTYYNSSMDEETKGGSSSIEKIQRHYRSAILAVKKLKKEDIVPKVEKLSLWKRIKKVLMG